MRNLRPAAPAVVGALLVAVAAGCIGREGGRTSSSPRNPLGPASLDPGPVITVVSDVLGLWRSDEPAETRNIFRLGHLLTFEWSATPGPSRAAVTEVCWAVDDTTTWNCAEDSCETGPPVEGELLVLFAPWEAGDHKLFVRAQDENGDFSLLEGRFRMFAGPRFTPEPDRYILVVLDTEPTDLIAQGIWPADYEQLELDRISDWFEGYNIQIHQTHGTDAPPLPLLGGASSLVWLHSTEVAQGTASVLARYHEDWPTEPPLAGYAWSGGNLLLCGIRPSEAMRYFRDREDWAPVRQDYPVEYESTFSDPRYLSHWASRELWVSRVVASVGGSPTGSADRRIRTATSSVVGGANPWPDLHFDRTTLPCDPQGFGLFDLGIEPRADTGEIAYRLNETEVPIGTRGLTSPGVNGNTVLLGFHPYFVESAEFRDLVSAVLSDFGETQIP